MTLMWMSIGLVLMLLPVILEDLMNNGKMTKRAKGGEILFIILPISLLILWIRVFGGPGHRPEIDSLLVPLTIAGLAIVRGFQYFWYIGAISRFRERRRFLQELLSLDSQIEKAEESLRRLRSEFGRYAAPTGISCDNFAIVPQTKATLEILKGKRGEIQRCLNPSPVEKL